MNRTIGSPTLRALAKCSIVLLLLQACRSAVPTPASAVPSDLSIEYRYSKGALPPPYSYDLTLKIGADGSGIATITAISDTPPNPVWTEAFAVPPDKLLAAYNVMLTNRVFTRGWREADDPPVGGSTESTTVKANGQTAKLPVWGPENQRAAADAIKVAVRALAGPVETKLETQRKAWEELQR